SPGHGRCAVRVAPPARDDRGRRPDPVTRKPADSTRPGKEKTRAASLENLPAGSAARGAEPSLRSGWHPEVHHHPASDAFGIASGDGTARLSALSMRNRAQP